jgi:hypothetical protein
MAKLANVGDLVPQQAKADSQFIEALLQEGIDAMLRGDLGTGKTIMGDYIKATVGFEKLGEAAGALPKSRHAKMQDSVKKKAPVRATGEAASAMRTRLLPDSFSIFSLAQVAAVRILHRRSNPQECRHLQRGLLSQPPV